MPHPLDALGPVGAIFPGLLLALMLGGCNPLEAADDTASGETNSARDVVLLELFTSQGCSSCPPADRLLVDLAKEEGVVALSFHVDYWNYIGWTDPFSAEAWTRRQHDYARVLRSDSVYTPQLVVDGRTHVVGSRPRDVESAIEDARRRPASAHLAISGLRIEGDTVRCTVTAGLLRAVPNAPRLLVALVQDGLTTPVSAGENRRQTLRNDRVVRQLEAVADLATTNGSRGTAEVSFRLDPEWSRGDLGLVAFVQNPQTLEVYGAVAAEHP